MKKGTLNFNLQRVQYIVKKNDMFIFVSIYDFKFLLPDLFKFENIQEKKKNELMYYISFNIMCTGQN